MIEEEGQHAKLPRGGGAGNSLWKGGNMIAKFFWISRGYTSL
jgi:hypothetical protein